MIWESSNWKEPLLTSANYLRRVRLKEGTSGRTCVRIEKEIFIGFYSIRKLLDTFKVSDATKAMTFHLSTHKSRHQVDYLNWHKLQQNYDLSASTAETHDIRFLCNQFIHSYVFIPAEEEDGRLHGFFVASDRDKGKKCYFVELAQIVKAFRVVGNDYPARSEMERDPKTGQWNGRIS